MIYNLYSVYDSKSESYAEPKLYLNDDVAKRSMYQLYHDIADTAEGRNSALVAYPEDFWLYRIGTYATDTALVISEVVPICSFTDFKEV